MTNHLEISASIPKAEIEIDESLITSLLEQQCSQFSNLPIKFLNSGWDNCIYRLGEELALRIPRRQFANALIINEQQYLAKIAPRLPLAVPAPIFCGAPTKHYPWHWSIIPWLEGCTADLSPPNSSAIKQWAAFLAALHIPGSKDGPHNPYRGNPLATYCERFDERFQRLCDKNLINKESVNKLWQQGLDADDTFSPCWGHGDLHSMNILCEDGKFTGVIDWGDMYVGDIAADLASFFVLFPEEVAEHSLLHEYRAGTAQIIRAKACAIFIAVTMLDTGVGKNLKEEHSQQVAIARKIFSHLGV